MKKRLLQNVRIGLALFLAVFSSNLLPAATAYAATQPWSEPTNHVSYWENLGYGTCSKTDYPDDTTDTNYTVPAAPSGSFWSLLVIKAGLFNEVYENPTVGATYNSYFDTKNDDKPQNDSYKEISHIITCVKSAPLTVPSAPVPTEPTCDAAGSLTLPSDTTDVHWSISPAYAGPGTYDVTATAQGGKVFIGGGATVSFNDIVVAPQLTENCSPEQITVTPVVPTVSDVCGTKDDKIIKPVDTAQITYSLTGNVVTATLVNPSTHDFAAAANGYVVAGDGLTATYTVTHQFTNAQCVNVCPAQLGGNLSTNADKNGWTVPAEAEYVNDGIKLNVAGGWDSTSITRNFSGTLADLGSAIDIDANPLQYVGIHVVTSKGVLTFEEEATYGGKWWSESDFGVASGMGYATFDTLENIAKANPDLAVTSVYVLYTHSQASSSTITSVTFGCVKYTFDKDGGCTRGCGNEDEDKVEICHRTNSVTHPYNKIEISEKAVDGQAGNSGNEPDHFGEHKGPVFSANANYPTPHNGDQWGDIIPPVAPFHNGLNWTEQGRAIYNNDCKSTTVKPDVVVKVPVCVDKGKTAPITVEVTNNNDSATAYRVVAGSYDNYFVIPAGDDHSFSIGNFGPGTYPVKVYEGSLPNGEVEEEDVVSTLFSQVAVPQYEWNKVYDQTFTVLECEKPVDVCPNVPGNQTNRDECGQTQGDTDVCPNITGSQTTVPTGKVKDSQGNCVTDICPNLTGIQTTLPAGFTQVNGDCVQPVGGQGQGQVLGTTLPATIPATGGTTMPNPLVSLVAAFLTYVFLYRRNRRAEV